MGISQESCGHGLTPMQKRLKPKILQRFPRMFFTKREAGYLNLGFFTIRLIAYFSIFCGLSYWLRKVSFTQDTDGDPKWTHMGMKISAAGIPAAALALTFGAFDLFMSLEYQWFSTMYGVWYFASGIRSALAVTIIACFYLSSKNRPLEGIYKQAHQYDLACLSLAFTVFWAYISFLSTFLSIVQTFPRKHSGMSFVKLTLIQGTIRMVLGQHGSNIRSLLLPFLYLLFYQNKINGPRLIFIVSWILVFHLLDLYWNIIPGREIRPGEFVSNYQARSVFNTHLIWGLFSLVGIGCLCV